MPPSRSSFTSFDFAAAQDFFGSQPHFALQRFKFLSNTPYRWPDNRNSSTPSIS